MSGSNIIEFQASFYSLNEFPDKNLIDSLTAFSKANLYSFASDIVDIICKRFFDSNVPSTHKLSIFYLMDSIMKSTREPYVPLFVYYFEKLVPSFFQQFSDPHRAKLLKLFGTWQERSLLTNAQINHLRLAVASAPQYQPRYVPESYQPQPQANGFISDAISSQVHWNNNSNYNGSIMGMQGSVIMNNMSDQMTYSDQTNLNSMYEGYFPAGDILATNASSVQQYSTGHGPGNLYTNPMPDKPNPSASQRNQLSFVRGQGKRQFLEQKQGKGNSNSSNSGSFGRNKSSNSAKSNDPRKTGNRNADNRFDNKRYKPSEEAVVSVPVREEMQNLLTQMLVDLGKPIDAITLVSLKRENAQLFHSMFMQAQDIVNTRSQGLSSGGYIYDSPMQPHSQGDYLNAVPSSYPEVLLNDYNAYIQSAAIDDSSNDNVNDISLAYSTSDESAKKHREYTTHLNLNIVESRLVDGFINESPVTISFARSESLIDQMLNANNAIMLSSDALIDCQHIAKRIRRYLQQLDNPSKIPPIIFGQLPTVPSARFLQSLAPTALSKALHKIPIPVFRFEELSQRPDIALKALYTNRPYLAEDGKRFITPDQLRKHADSLITARIEKKKQLLRGEAMAIERRLWYQPVSIWTNASSSVPGSSLNGSGALPPKASLLSINNDLDEYIVPADENFVRCPISKEAFDKFWDDNEGEYMYRNAVKLLVTNGSDENVYTLGRPTGIPTIKYLIVRKPLIVDGWLASGKAATLPEALKRYRSMGRDATFLEDLVKAGSEGESDASVEDMDDVFVLLELVR